MRSASYAGDSVSQMSLQLTHNAVCNLPFQPFLTTLSLPQHAPNLAESGFDSILGALQRQQPRPPLQMNPFAQAHVRSVLPPGPPPRPPPYHEPRYDDYGQPLVYALKSDPQYAAQHMMDFRPLRYVVSTTVYFQLLKVHIARCLSLEFNNLLAMHVFVHMSIVLLDIE